VSKIILILRWLSLVGVIFVFIFLYQTGESDVFQQFSVSNFLLAIFCLLIVFVIRAWIWWLFLLRFQIKISFKKATNLLFKPVLSKYIPGKVWFLMSSAATIHGAGISFGHSGFLLIVWQLMLISSGLFVGVFGLFFYHFIGASFKIQSILLLMTIATTVLLIKNKRIPQFVAKFLRKFLKTDLSRYEIPPMMDLFMLLAANWMMMGGAFVICFQAVSLNAGFLPIFFQPLANNIGVMAFFVPAGLGAREGVMMGYLSLLGITKVQAGVAVIMARLWFTLVDVLLFLSAVFIFKETDTAS
jgi:uncharacterized membrane protein YbhN (UPF0104 family)